MRHPLSFTCEGAELVATLDAADGACGLLIVSGGNEIRSGAHRGMAQLAADIASGGFPVWRFDRRGIGDSEGENGGFETSGPDLASAMKAFRAACPALRRIIAFGNCDAAAALLLHSPQGIDAMVLANIWTIEGESDLPPPAAIKARYWERARDPKTWLRLVSGGVNIRKLVAGLMRVARPTPPSTPTSLVARLAARLAAFKGPVSILLSTGDATAIAFADAWGKPAFEAVRTKPNVALIHLDSASHSFAREADYGVLKGAILGALAKADSQILR